MTLALVITYTVLSPEYLAAYIVALGIAGAIVVRRVLRWAGW